MEQSRRYSVFLIIILCCFLLLCFLGSPVESYKNYTVGDSLGWYDTLEKPNVDYQKWSAGKNFSLGDFLIFNTDNNHSVVVTYNSTTYKLCDYDNSQENDTTEWSTSDPSNTATHDVSVAVPLLKQGMTYFFSSDYDGEQCNNGQHFEINVTYGQGLPESLKDPSEQSPGPISPDSGGDEVPDTSNFNFNNPQNASDDNKQVSGSVSLSLCWKLMDKTRLHRILVLLGIVCLF